MRRSFAKRSRGSWGVRRAALLLLTLGLIAAACGTDGEDPAEPAADPPADDPADPGDEPVEGALDRPIRLAHVISQSGPNALPFFQDGHQLAVDEINAAGGILGQPIESTVYDTELDAEAGVNAARRAISDEPDFIICCSGGAVLQAVSPILTEEGIPTLGYSLGVPANLSEIAGSPWMWRMASESYLSIVAGAMYYADELGVENVGLMGLSIDYGTLAMPVFRAVFEDRGVEVVGERLYPFGVTDVTEEALALRDAEAIIDWSYPNENGVVLSRLTQEGFEGPYLGSASVSVMVDRDLAPREALPRTHSSTMCWPMDDERDYVREWAQEFRDTHGYNPDFGAAYSYDAVYVMKAAIEAAGSLDPEAIADAMNNEVAYTDGVCAFEYRSDEEHRLNRDTVIVQFDENLDGEIVATYRDLDVEPFVAERQLAQ